MNQLPPTDDDAEWVSRSYLAQCLLGSLHGMFVGMLSDDELHLFEAAIRAGKARRQYVGVAGLLGMAKVEVL